MKLNELEKEYEELEQKLYETIDEIEADEILNEMYYISTLITKILQNNET